MSTALRSPFLFLAVAVGIVACGTSEDTAGSSSDLMGGNVAAEGDFPGVVSITNDEFTYNCTATKVGPRHLLLAAHCVVNFSVDAGTLSSAFLPGAELSVAYSRATRDSRLKAKVEHTYLSDTWVQNCKGQLACSIVDPKRWASSDVALVVTTQDFPQIPSAVVDLDSVATDDRVVVLGYGCESGTGSDFDYSKARLKTGETKVVPVTAVRHKDSHVWNDDPLPVIDRLNAITLGPGLDPNAPGLCPGDSGGPLLRAGAKTTTVIGINSAGTFAFDLLHPQSTPDTNWFARVDAASAIGEFLQAHGVAVTHACADPGVTCANANYRAP